MSLRHLIAVRLFPPIAGQHLVISLCTSRIPKHLVMPQPTSSAAAPDNTEKQVPGGRGIYERRALRLRVRSRGRRVVSEFHLCKIHFE